MTRPHETTDSRFENYGLSAFTFRRTCATGVADDLRSVPHHTHLEIEIHFVEEGAVSLDFVDHEVRLERGELVAFWGGMPHRDVDPAAPTTVYHVAQLPIVNLLAWAGAPAVLNRLLGGEILTSTPSPPEVVADGLAFARWSTDLAVDDPRLRAAVEMEIQARLLRLLHYAAPSRYTLSRTASATAQVVAAAIHYVTMHFSESITVDDVAKAAGRHHDHLMTSFRRICGVTLWEYVTRLRLTEAQRLLATSDLPVLTVCHRAGFSSTSRMYEAFHRHYGQTPAAYRERMSR